jgi:hypothetical protein
VSSPVAEGWLVTPGARVAHFVATDGRVLCGRPPLTLLFAPPERTTSSANTCKTCLRIRAAGAGPRVVVS